MISKIIDKNLAELLELQKEHEQHQKLFIDQHEQMKDISDIFFDIQNMLI